VTLPTLAGVQDVELAERLRERGYRMTAQRQLVLDAVRRLDHAAPDDILAAVSEREQGVNLSTVYRTLEVLEEIGLVAHTHLGHGAPAYHSTAEPAHLHLVCRRCDRVTEAPTELADGLVATLAAEHGFETDVRHLTVFGDCENCKENH
jgi:Fur family transcriptional regulator, ferric uptake regulator